MTGNRFWLSYLNSARDPQSRVGLHLAVFSEPFLGLVLGRQKTIESRFSRVRCAPFGEVADGDVIFLKEVAGPICGLALVKQTWFYDLTYESLDRIREQHNASICADPAYWESRRGAIYATLMEIGEAASIVPLPCDKRDRRGWVPLRSRQLAFGF